MQNKSSLQYSPPPWTSTWRGSGRGSTSRVVVDHSLKTNDGRKAYNKAGIVPRAIGIFKEPFPKAAVMTDVALDPYSDQGHAGIVLNGKNINDETIEQLCKQAVCQARAGADIVVPSDMMDGRVGAL